MYWEEALLSSPHLPFHIKLEKVDEWLAEEKSVMQLTSLLPSDRGILLAILGRWKATVRLSVWIQPIGRSVLHVKTTVELSNTRTYVSNARTLLNVSVAKCTFRGRSAWQYFLACRVYLELVALSGSTSKLGIYRSYPSLPVRKFSWTDWLILFRQQHASHQVRHQYFIPLTPYSIQELMLHWSHCPPCRGKCLATFQMPVAFVLFLILDWTSVKEINCGKTCLTNYAHACSPSRQNIWRCWSLSICLCIFVHEIPSSPRRNWWQQMDCLANATCSLHRSLKTRYSNLARRTRRLDTTVKR